MTVPPDVVIVDGTVVNGRDRVPAVDSSRRAIGAPDVLAPLGAGDVAVVGAVLGSGVVGVLGWTTGAGTGTGVSA